MRNQYKVLQERYQLVENDQITANLEARKPAISPSGWKMTRQQLKFTGNISPDGQSGEYIHPIQKYIFWFDKNGVKHRTDGPAYISKTGNKKWFQNGRLHRLDGPAVIYSGPGREKYWYINDKYHTEEEFNDYIAAIKAQQQHTGTHGVDLSNL